MLRCLSQQVRIVPRRTRTIAPLHEVLSNFDRYQADTVEQNSQPLIAYFCAEYGFHESFPIYSGGLGILAGDHCKAASDEQLNFVAVGLLYRQGYFTQSVDADGVQHAGYGDADPRDLPVEPVRDAAGNWLTVQVPIAEREVEVRVWLAQVGHVSVYLLDTNTPANTAADRDITFRLYGGDESHRIRQEMILGLGGARALRRLGLAPAVWHTMKARAFSHLNCCVSSLRSGARSKPASRRWPRSVRLTRTRRCCGPRAFQTPFIKHFGGQAKAMGVRWNAFSRWAAARKGRHVQT